MAPFDLCTIYSVKWHLDLTLFEKEGAVRVRCFFCGADDTRVIETRTSDEGYVIRRRRECLQCQHRFTTQERLVESRLLWVIKKDGRRESFDRDKLLHGLVRACEKLPVSIERLEEAVSRIEAKLRDSKQGEISSIEVGELAMQELQEIHNVAYVRFASVYREFTDLSSFTAEISRLLEKK